MNFLDRFLSLKFFFLPLFFWSILNAEGIKERPFVLVIPSYNNEQWIYNNLVSVIQQKYQNFRVIYLNDASDDNTGSLAEEFIRNRGLDIRVVDFFNRGPEYIPQDTDIFCSEVNQKKNFFILVNNKRRCGAMANLYRMSYSCNDEEIVINLDGDDWLYDNEVLKRLNEAYGSGEVWYTHGTLMEYPQKIIAWSQPIPKEIIEKSAFREYRCPSHLRTYYAWLFKKIKPEDLMQDGDFFKMTSDMAIMFPIAEMAAERHFFVSELNYVYNTTNPINDNKVNAQLQRDLDVLIRNKERYPRLTGSDIPEFMKINETDKH